MVSNVDDWENNPELMTPVPEEERAEEPFIGEPRGSLSYVPPKKEPPKKEPSSWKEEVEGAYERWKKRRVEEEERERIRKLAQARKGASKTVGERVRGPIRKHVGPGLAGAHAFSAKESLYVPQTPSIKGIGEPAKKALTPSYGPLREASQLGPGTRTADDLSALRAAGQPQLGRLRGDSPFASLGFGQAPSTAQFPRDWSTPMKAVYQFLQEQGNRATTADIDELARTAGISKTVTSQAVSALTGMGYIVKEGKGQTASLMLTDKVPR